MYVCALDVDATRKQVLTVMWTEQSQRGLGWGREAERAQSWNMQPTGGSVMASWKKR